jgi:hypothetical protein
MQSRRRRVLLFLQQDEQEMVMTSGHFETPRSARNDGTHLAPTGNERNSEDPSTTFRCFHVCAVRDGATNGSRATVVRWRRETSASRLLAAGAHTALSNLTVEYRFTFRANHDRERPSNPRPPRTEWWIAPPKLCGEVSKSGNSGGCAPTRIGWPSRGAIESGRG